MLFVIYEAARKRNLVALVARYNVFPCPPALYWKWHHELTVSGCKHSLSCVGKDRQESEVLHYHKQTCPLHFQELVFSIEKTHPQECKGKFRQIYARILLAWH